MAIIVSAVLRYEARMRFRLVALLIVVCFQTNEVSLDPRMLHGPCLLSGDLEEKFVQNHHPC